MRDLDQKSLAIRRHVVRLPGETAWRDRLRLKERPSRTRPKRSFGFDIDRYQDEIG
jgi:hypothetical protein